MKSKLVTAAMFLLVLAGSVFATERIANKYSVHKLALNSVLISCEDEREPVARKLENGPFIIVTCQTSPAK